MSMGLIISIIVSLLSLVLCTGVAFFLFCLVLGIVLLRRRGKKNVTANEAVKHGVETVSMVFRRGADGNLEEVTGPGADDDEDAAAEEGDKEA